MRHLRAISMWAACGLCLTAGSLLPAMWAGILVHAIRARRFLGYWPSYGLPDPKDLPPWLQIQPMENAASAAVAVLLLSAGVAYLRTIERPWRRLGMAALCGIAGIGLGLVLFFADPGGFRAWYFD